MKAFASLSLILVLGGSADLKAELPAFKDFFKASSLGKVQTKDTDEFIVSWVHPRDEVIVEALLFHLSRANRDLAPLWKTSSGGKKVPIEIFPDLKSFSEVSGLSLARFKATGTIALTLEQRLMILSPRNLWSGYSWATTVVHEYIHYLIREVSMDHIPIWLHEGTAQLYQGYPYEKDAQLKPAQWGLFKKYRNQKKLLSLETLKEPFPMRKDPEEAELAYIQALLFVKWLDKKCGAIRLIQMSGELKSVEKGLEKCTKQPGAQLAKVFIPEIMNKVEIPAGSDVEFYARDFSGKSPEDIEGKKTDVVARNFSQLATKLFDQGRFRGSAFEMKRAIEKTPAAPPSWQRQLALSLEKSQQSEQAMIVLQKLLKDYPEDATGWFLKGQKLFSEKKISEAWNAFVRAFFVNPFLEGLTDQMQTLKAKDPKLDYAL